MTHNEVNNDVSVLAKGGSASADIIEKNKFAVVLTQYYKSIHQDFFDVFGIKFNKVFYNRHNFRVSYLIADVPYFEGVIDFNYIIFTEERHRIYTISQIIN